MLFFCVLAFSLGARAATWQQSDPSGENYLKTRRALTSPQCQINTIGVSVGVASTVENLGNMMDQDLTNYASFKSVVSATTGYNPIVSVRDMKDSYAAGTEAGFLIKATKGAKVLDLNLASSFMVQFYKDGKSVGAVGGEQTTGLLNLSVLSISTDDVEFEIKGKAPAAFDEIALVPVGIKAGVLDVLNIKYAFVGSDKTYLTKEGIKEYSRNQGRPTMNISAEGYNAVLLGIPFKALDSGDLIDENLTNGITITPILTVGFQGSAAVTVTPSTEDQDQTETFKAGTKIGFDFTFASALNLSVGAWTKIKLYNIDDKEVEEHDISAEVLGLALIGGEKRQVIVTASHDFSKAEIDFYTGVKLDLGGFDINDAFVVNPTNSIHACELGVSADASVCDDVTSYDLTAKQDVNWAITSEPDGASATLSSASGTSTTLSGMTETGNYVITATSKADVDAKMTNPCKETITIVKGCSPSVNTDEQYLVNTGSTSDSWTLSDENHQISGSLISISNLKNAANIVTPSIDDYAEYTGGLSALDNIRIVGVKKENGTITTTEPMRVGFEVEMSGTSLSLDLLNFFNIRLYNNGTEVTKSDDGKTSITNVVSNSQAVSANLVGTTHSQKVKWSIKIPAGTTFDEIALWKSGTLSVNLSDVRIYYAYMEPETAAEAEDNAALTSCVNIVSKDQGAYIDGNLTGITGTASVLTYLTNMSNLVDGSLSTYLGMAQTVEALNKITIGVNLGRTYKKNQEVGVVLNNITGLANLSVASDMYLQTYKDGTLVSPSSKDWGLLGLNVIQVNNQAVLFMKSNGDFNQLQIVYGNGVDALKEGIQLAAVVTRNDADNDGIPDCIDENPCNEEFVINEDWTKSDNESGVATGDTEKKSNYAKGSTYTSARMILKRTLNQGKWNSIVLPVSLTLQQFYNAFGEDASLAQFCSTGLDSSDPNRILFNIVTKPTSRDEEYLTKGVNYLIYPTSSPTYDDKSSYTAKGFASAITGPLYVIDGVSYKDMSLTDGRASTVYSDINKHNGITIYGTYVSSIGTEEYPINPTTTPCVPGSNTEHEGVYGFSGGTLYRFTSKHNIKALRFWIEDTRTSGSAKPLSFNVNGSSTTAIKAVEEGLHGHTTMVYNLLGQPVGTAVEGNNATILSHSLPAGVYIIGNRKVLIK